MRSTSRWIIRRSSKPSAWLESTQQPSGAWGETCRSYDEPALKGTGEPTPSQTAWATLGLIAAGRARSPAVRRGIDYLVETQLADGSWEENSFTGTGFPRVFYLRYHYYRVYFPLMAIARHPGRPGRRRDRLSPALRPERSGPAPIAGRCNMAKIVALAPMRFDSLRHGPQDAMPRRSSSMRFPLPMTTRIAGYVARKRLAGAKKFPMVLMLEPLHACNLTCTGCGRIREYESTIKQKLSIEECLAAVDECGAPVVSICGGEPMIYPGLGELVAKIQERKKVIILCTNGMFIRKKLERLQAQPHVLLQRPS